MKKDRQEEYDRKNQPVLENEAQRTIFNAMCRAAKVIGGNSMMLRVADGFCCSESTTYESANLGAARALIEALDEAGHRATNHRGLGRDLPKIADISAKDFARSFNGPLVGAYDEDNQGSPRSIGEVSDRVFANSFRS